MTQQAILCFLIKDDQILLAESDYRLDRKTWNGITGFITNQQKIEFETAKVIYDAIKVQINPQDLEKVAVQHVFQKNSDESIQETVTISIFFCDRFIGEPHLTGNFRPRWFSLDDIPYEEMFEDTKDWLPRLLSGEKLIIEILTEENTNNQIVIKDVTVRNIFS